MRTKILMLLMGLMWVPLNQLAIAQDNEGAVEPLVVKIYDVSDLIAADYTPSYDSDSWPGSGMFRFNGEPGFSGGLGGMGGGGGGMFAVPPQMGGGGQGGMAVGGGMGGGQGGMGGGGGGGFAALTRVSSEEFNLDAAGGSLMDLLQNSIDSTTWMQEGGEGRMNLFHSQLVVTQKSAVHQHLAEFLVLLREAKQNTKVIQMDWLAIKADQVTMKDLTDVTDEALNQFMDEAWVQRGGVSTLNGHVGFTTAAEHRNLVISVTPVVGAGGTQERNVIYGNQVGYQPKVVKPALGWLVQLRPLIPAGDDPVGRIQVGANYTSAPEVSETKPGQIDRGNISSFLVGGMVQAKANQWAVVGGMGAKPKGDGQTEDQFYIIVRWNEVKGK